MKNAKAALKQILENQDYLFVAEHESLLSTLEKECIMSINFIP